MGNTFTLVKQFGNPTFNSLTVSGSVNFTGSVTTTNNIVANGYVSASSFSGAGTGLTGTASSLSIGGNSATVGGLSIHSGRNNEANKIVRTQDNGYILCGYINSSNGNENNNSNPDRVWGTNGSDDYLRTYRTSALSVSYASTAGSATTAGNITAYTINQNVGTGNSPSFI
jgi:uncharacterized protein YunC (DUF1805 family)